MYVYVKRFIHKLHFEQWERKKEEQQQQNVFNSIYERHELTDDYDTPHWWNDHCDFWAQRIYSYFKCILEDDRAQTP